MAAEAWDCCGPAVLATACSAQLVCSEAAKDQEGEECPSRGCHKARASVQRAVRGTPWYPQCGPEGLSEQLAPWDRGPRRDAECQSRRSQRLGGHLKRVMLTWTEVVGGFR